MVASSEREWTTCRPHIREGVVGSSCLARGRRGARPWPGPGRGRTAAASPETGGRRPRVVREEEWAKIAGGGRKGMEGCDLFQDRGGATVTASSGKGGGEDGLQERESRQRSCLGERGRVERLPPRPRRGE